jgi:transposase
MTDIVLRRDANGRLIPTTARTGRPSKLTPERHEKIVDLVKSGVPIETAAAAAGIDQRTYYYWVGIGKTVHTNWGPDPDQWPIELTPYEKRCAHFFHAVRIANAEAEATAIIHVRTAMPKHWQAAMAWLERRYPDRWRRRDELTMSPMDGPQAQATTIDEQALLSDPAAVALMHEALEMTARGTGLGPSSQVDPSDEVVDPG